MSSSASADLLVPQWEPIPAAAGQQVAEPARTVGTRTMEAPEIAAFLASHEWGVLATVGEEGPYAVPVSYGYDEGTLFLAMGPGRKLRNLLEDPALCLTVLEVRTTGSWESVVVTGRAVQLAGIRERVQALNALRRQRSAPPSTSDLSRLAKASLLRIEVGEVTGRGGG